MKNFKINLNSFFTILLLLLFITVTAGSLFIAKRGMHAVFSNQIERYFKQSANFIQTVFNEKMQEVTIATKLVNIPKEVLEGSSAQFQLFLQESINEYIDFFVYLPQEEGKEVILEGLFLYDIKPLKVYLKNRVHTFQDEHFVNIKTKKENYAFLLSKKKIVDKQSGQILGILVGGIELSFHNDFLNKIKNLTNLKTVSLFSHNKPLSSFEKIPQEKSATFFELLNNNSVTLVKHKRLSLNGEPVDLHVAMSSSSHVFNLIKKQLKGDLVLLFALALASVFFLVIVIRIILIQPLLSLKEYAAELSAGKQNPEKPHMCIDEYRDLQNHLQELFVKLLHSKEQQREQYTDLLKAKSKLDESMRLVDKFVILTSTDLEGNITDASEAFEKLSGYSKEELIGKTHKLMQSPKTPKKLYKELWETITNGDIWEGEICNITKSGKNYWTHNIIAPNFEGAQVIGYTAVRKDITDKKKIEALATTDALTGLYNRRHMEEALLQAYEHYKRYKEAFTLMMIDIDYFKQVNDSYGHQTGDEVLKGFAKILRANARKTDLIGRWGGEEFLIFMPKTTLLQGEYVAQKIKKAVCAYPFKEVEQKTASFGVAEFQTDIATTIKKADEALYRAKELGRNQVQIAKNT